MIKLQNQFALVATIADVIPIKIVEPQSMIPDDYVTYEIAGSEKIADGVFVFYYEEVDA